MHGFLSILTTWITAHQDLDGLTIFLVSFAESLALVGLIMPRALLILTAGALIATDTLSFWSTMGWAVFGDGFSFWLGHHFKDRIRFFPLFSCFPDILGRGESFFHQHGGTSVFFGCFVGPVRPVVPLIAGMLGTCLSLVRHGLRRLSVLPQVHDGRHGAMLLMPTLPGAKKEFLALRFWPADILLDNLTPLWVGTLSRRAVRRYMKLISLPRTEEAVSVEYLIPALSGTDLLLEQVDQGRILLIQDRGTRR